jgi:hypothetical protein
MEVAVIAGIRVAPRGLVNLSNRLPRTPSWAIFLPPFREGVQRECLLREGVQRECFLREGVQRECFLVDGAEGACSPGGCGGSASSGMVWRERLLKDGARGGAVGGNSAFASGAGSAILVCYANR